MIRRIVSIYPAVFFCTLALGCDNRTPESDPKPEQEEDTYTEPLEERDTETSAEWDTFPEKGDGLAMTPPMGWNSWNCFKDRITQTLIMETADAMVESGMKDAGYEYVNLDDGWMDRDGRDENGYLIPNAARFPDGMAALADYIHGLGLKIGIYGDRGTMTCMNIPESGSFGYEAQDAQTFADWGIDYLKYDNCNLPEGREDATILQEDYEKMAQALRDTGRPIVFSLCAWGWYGEWMIEAGHLWRSTGDISDCWTNDDICQRATWENGIVEIIDQNATTAEFAGPGHWNDADMLEVGNGELSDKEYISHFSLWSIMAAPLIAGNDLRIMTQETIDILTNEEVIAVDQDPSGIQGTRVVDDGDLEVWVKPLKNHNSPEKAVVLFNRSDEAAEMTVDFADIDLSGTATVRDLWAKEDLGEFVDTFSTNVKSRGVVMLKIVEKYYL